MTPHLLESLALVATSAPAAAFLVVSLTMLLPRQLPERRLLQLTAWTFSLALIATLALTFSRLLGLESTPELNLGPLFALRSYHFEVRFLLDGPALLFLTLNYALCGLIGAFSARYLHQDPGYRRFYLLLLLFSSGVTTVAAAAGLDLLFAGWELLGLTSALLVAFFYRRVSPVANALRVYSVYRITDVGLLVALVALHHSAGTVEFGDIARGTTGLGLAAFALVFGAMGKGAVVPFTGWLPRAMEGPTPSSAIFYGALSVHASPFLLLRVYPILESTPGALTAVVALGAITAVHASMAGRVQTDIKTSLAYASAAQVALIWIEVGLGWTTLALVHLGGHSVLRTWQLLRAPSQLHDRHHLSRALGLGLPSPVSRFETHVPLPMRTRLYQWSLERWFLDDLLDRLAGLLLAPARWLDRIDHTLVDTVEGDMHQEPTTLRVSPDTGTSP